MDTDIWRRGIGLVVLMMLVGGMAGPAEAQITIEEKMEIGLKTNENIETPSSLPSDQPPEVPFYRMDGYRFLVLQSGELTLQFDEAYGYGANTPDDDTLHVIFETKDSRIENIPVRQYLRDPLTYRETYGSAQCQETEFYYGDNSVSRDILIGQSKTDSKITSVSHYNAYYGGYNDINNNKYIDDLFIGLDYGTTLRDIDDDDEAEELDWVSQHNVYLEFTIDGYQTNGMFDSAFFEFNQIRYYGTFDSVQTFSVNMVTDPWTEQGITWNNQPGIADSIIQTDEDRGPYISIDVGAEFSVNITDYAESWLSDPSTNHGIMLKSEEEGSQGHFVSPSTTDITFGWPRLTLLFSNPHPAPDVTEISVGHVEAGDIINLNYSGVSNEGIPDEDHDFLPSPSQQNQEKTTFSKTQNQQQNLSSQTSFNFYQENGTCDEHRLDLTHKFQHDNGQDSVWVVPNPDTSAVAPGDTVIFNPQLKFSNGRTLSFPNLQLFEVELINGESFGTLFADSEDDTTDFLEEVNTGFGFIAGDSLNIDSTLASTVKVRTELGWTGEADDGGIIIIAAQPDAESGSSDATAFVPSTVIDPDEMISGSNQILIKRDSLLLTLEIPGTNEIWPTLRARDGGNDGDRNIKESVVVSLTRDQDPVTENPLAIKALRIKGSGGHNHEIGGDEVPEDSLGTFTLNNEELLGSLEAQTDQNGELEFDYIGSMISGKYILQAETQVGGDSLFARDTLLVRVPDLVSMGEDTSYVLSGGTCAHHGASTDGIAARCETPDNNHYVTEAARDSLVDAAEEYLTASWNTDNEKVRINDISLPLGGYFGIDLDWTGAHVSHRIGEDVDIENISNLDNLKEAFLDNGWEFISHDGSGFYPHFRLKD